MRMIDKRLEAFSQAIGVLPLRLQHEAQALSGDLQESCEEIRLRVGKPMALSRATREIVFGTGIICPEDLQDTLSRATRYSVHSFGDSIQNGFVTLEGGHRMGLCGTAILRDGLIGGMRSLSSINLRIAVQMIGVADAIIEKIIQKESPISTLIISPPAWGKTTLLRDCVRQLSIHGIRVGVADERCEISGASAGIPQFELGPTTDVLDGAPKAQAAMLLLKTMSPAVLVMDEITAMQDVEAVSYAAHCGASVLATAHALNLNEFQRRPLYQQLLRQQVFGQVIEIVLEQGIRRYNLIEMGEDMLC